MNETLKRWLERNRVQGEAQRQMAMCLSEPAESSVAALLFAVSEQGQEANLEQKKRRLSEFVEFARKKRNSGQVRRLRDLVARLPDRPERWSEFIEHELQRPKSAWTGISEAAEALAASLDSEPVGKQILRSVYDTEYLRSLSRDYPERLSALNVEWRRHVFLALVDPIIAQAKAQEGVSEQ